MEPKKIKTYVVKRYNGEGQYLLAEKDISNSKAQDTSIEIISDIKLYTDLEIDLDIDKIKKDDMFGEYYKISSLSDISKYPEELVIINSKFSGKVVEHYSGNMNTIKLDKKIKLPNKTISQVEICDDDLLVAMKIENIKFESYHLLDNSNEINIYTKNYTIAKEDLDLIKHSKEVFKIFQVSLISIIGLFIISFISNFALYLYLDNSSLITAYKLEYVALIIYAYLFFRFIPEHVFYKYRKAYKKDQLKEIFSTNKLLTLIVGFLIFFSLIYKLTLGITYKSDCVYDSEKKILITKPYFYLNSDITDIEKRYIPIYSNYQYKILVKNTENLDYNKIVFLDFDLSFAKNDNLISLKEKLQKAVISTQEIVNKKTYQFNEKDNTAIMNENSRLEIAKIFLSELEKAGVDKNDIENYKYNLDIKTFWFLISRQKKDSFKKSLFYFIFAKLLKKSKL